MFLKNSIYLGLILWNPNAITPCRCLVVPVSNCCCYWHVPPSQPHLLGFFSVVHWPQWENNPIKSVCVSVVLRCLLKGCGADGEGWRCSWRCLWMFQTGGGVSSTDLGEIHPRWGLWAGGKDVTLLGFFLSNITLCPWSVAKLHPERAVPLSCEVFFWYCFQYKQGRIKQSMFYSSFILLYLILEP